MNTISQAYKDGISSIRAQFDTPPELLLSGPSPDRMWTPSLAGAIHSFQKELGAEKSPLTGTEPVIITGQQPGMFTGPLYTILKAITTIQAAEALGRQGKPCIPLFWVAGDDHDFDEVRTTHFLDRRCQIRSLTYEAHEPYANTSDIPMYRMPLSDKVHELIDTASSSCWNSELTAGVVSFLHDSLDDARSLSHWFCLIMARLFSRTDLRLFQPSIEAARKASIPVLRKEIENPLHSTRLLIQEGEKLVLLGFKAPIQRNAGACNFFIEVEGHRRNVTYQQGKYLVRGCGLSYTVDEMHALLDASPERFSPNVALRPVVQQLLFAPVAYVGGPGEIDYWAQLKPLFSFFELPMPIVYPRLRAVISTVKLNRLLGYYNITKDDLAAQSDLLTRFLHRGRDLDLSRTFMEDRAHVEEAMNIMVSRLTAPTASESLKKAAKACRRHGQFHLDKLERALLYADKERRTTAESRLQRLTNAFYPFNLPQERVFCIFSFLFRHGWPLIEHMIHEFDFSSDTMQELEL